MVYLPRLDGAAVVELADTQDSKSCARKGMSVRLRPAAPSRQGTKDSPHQNKFGAGQAKSRDRKPVGVRLSPQAPLRKLQPWLKKKKFNLVRIIY